LSPTGKKPTTATTPRRRQGRDRDPVLAADRRPRLIRHARHLVLRLSPGHCLLAEVLARLRELPAPA
jgi:hypothetical protein